MWDKFSAGFKPNPQSPVQSSSEDLLSNPVEDLSTKGDIESRLIEVQSQSKKLQRLVVGSSQPELLSDLISTTYYDLTSHNADCLSVGSSSHLCHICLVTEF